MVDKKIADVEDGLSFYVRPKQKAFNGNKSLELAFLLGMDVHYEMDSVRPGSYETCTIACNVGVVNRCLGLSLQTNDHAGLAAAICVPERVLQFQEAIYEGLPSEERRAFPRDFARALAACEDLTYVWQKQMVWLLREELATKYRSIDAVAWLYNQWIKGNRPTDSEFKAAADWAVECAADGWEAAMYAAMAAWTAEAAAMASRAVARAVAATARDNALIETTLSTARLSSKKSLPNALAVKDIVRDVNLAEADAAAKSYNRQRMNLLLLLNNEGR